MLWKWNAWNTEPTVPSTENNKIVEVVLEKISYFIDVYDTPLGNRWLKALQDNLENKRILEKNFCFLGFADSKRDLRYLTQELNKNITQINSFRFDPQYEKIEMLSQDDFQYSHRNGYRLKHDACNLLHRYFEELQGTAWKLSGFYKQADYKTKYAIRQLNNLCHEIESWVLSYRKKMFEPEWMRPSQITTFLNAPRYDLHNEDFELFKKTRYRRELGGVYLHWCQVGKTLYEVFRDEGGVKMTETMCSEINHQKYYSGEFDVEWGQTIDEDTFDWKQKEMDDYRAWLKLNGYDWEDPRLALGYIKIGQVDLKKTFGENAEFQDIYDIMSKNLNIRSIKTFTNPVFGCDYPYTLESEDWKNIQMKTLRDGYESRGMC